MRAFIITFIIVNLLHPSLLGAQDSSISEVKPPTKIVDNTFDVDERFKKIEEKLDLLIRGDKSWRRDIGAIATLIVGLLAALSGFGVAYFTQREQRNAAKEDRLESHLFDSLKWFEKGTQKRSIGISIIEGNWSNVKTLHATWIALLVNQAVYLVAEKEIDRMTAHELSNRHRIYALLKKAPLTKEQREELDKAIKVGEETGRLKGDDLKEWKAI